MLFKMWFKLWVAALLGAYDVIQDGRHLGHHLGFYLKLEIIKKQRKLKIFDAGHVEYDVNNLLLFSPKRVKSMHLKNWPDHLLPMTSYFVTITTDFHQTCVKMCLRATRRATENDRCR